MSKPSLRRTILVSSVKKLLGPGENVHQVVMLWTRHRWFVPYTAFAAVALFALATALGIAGLTNRLVLAGCGVAVAGMATTNYWVLAETDDELVLLRSSRVRQYAKEVVDRLSLDTKLEMIGSTVVTSDWRIGSSIYTLTKRWEAAMRHIASTH